MLSSTSRLGAVHADKLLGIHLNLLTVRRDPALLTEANTDEQTYLGELATWLKEEIGYQWIQGTRPQTLAFGLNDSPAGLAAWIIEKFRAWSGLRRRPRERVQPRPSAREHQSVLVHRRYRLIVLALLRASARTLADTR